MNRLLLTQERDIIEISHIYYLVSAYKPTEYGELGYEELRQAVAEAAKIAKDTRETQIVAFDRVDFCLHVFPSGAVSLMVAIKEWDSFSYEA